MDTKSGAHPKPTDHLPPVRGSNHNPSANRLKEIERLLNETQQIFEKLEEAAIKAKKD